MKFLIFILCVTLFESVQGRTQFSIEKADLKSYDPDYFYNASGLLQNGKLNFEMWIIHPFYDNVTMKFKNYELVNGDYKPGVLKISQPICTAVGNPFFHKLMAKSNTNIPKKCPMEGQIYTKDLEMSFGKIPIGMPKTKHRIDLSFNVNDKKILLVEIFIKIE